ncbi:MAG: hypothetical protein M3R48_06875 [Candidatus Dormibacteraeota bacterium]|nr:hypothetical protein [Candidatus Dormibacteraeota bacterium]
MTADDQVIGQGDTLTPAEWSEILDRNAGGSTLVGIYQILHRRFADDPSAQTLLASGDLRDMYQGSHDGHDGGPAPEF